MTIAWKKRDLVHPLNPAISFGNTCSCIPRAFSGISPTRKWIYAINDYFCRRMVKFTEAYSKKRVDNVYIYLYFWLNVSLWNVCESTCLTKQYTILYALMSVSLTHAGLSLICNYFQQTMQTNTQTEHVSDEAIWSYKDLVCVECSLFHINRR